MQVLNEQLDKSQQHEPRSSGEGREAVPPTPNGNTWLETILEYILY